MNWGVSFTHPHLGLGSGLGIESIPFSHTCSDFALTAETGVCLSPIM